jgi:hypothetical protein
MMILLRMYSVLPSAVAIIMPLAPGSSTTWLVLLTRNPVVVLHAHPAWCCTCFRYPLPEEDFEIGMRAYEWPKRMVDIMKEASTKANAEHKEFEQQLKKRRKVCGCG